MVFSIIFSGIVSIPVSFKIPMMTASSYLRALEAKVMLSLFINSNLGLQSINCLHHNYNRSLNVLLISKKLYVGMPLTSH